jgi:quercetin dioxygenase-like cupin family protein
VNTGTDEVSIARMASPPGWSEPGQTPEFNEYTLVLSGSLHVSTSDGEFIVLPGQAFIAEAGEWVRYHTPDGAKYIAVCVPAFSMETVKRVD